MPVPGKLPVLPVFVSVHGPEDVLSLNVGCLLEGPLSELKKEKGLLVMLVIPVGCKIRVITTDKKKRRRMKRKDGEKGESHEKSEVNTGEIRSYRGLGLDDHE